MPKFGPRSTTGPPQIHTVSVPDRPQINSGTTAGRAWADDGSTEDRPRIGSRVDPGSTPRIDPNRPRIDPRCFPDQTPNRLQIDPAPTPDLPRSTPVPAFSWPLPEMGMPRRKRARKKRTPEVRNHKAQRGSSTAEGEKKTETAGATGYTRHCERRRACLATAWVAASPMQHRRSELQHFASRSGVDHGPMWGRSEVDLCFILGRFGDVGSL